MYYIPFFLIISLILIYILYKYNQTSYKNQYIDKDLQYWKNKNLEILEIDKILDKINKIGYKNLTQKEKDFLKNKSKK